MEICEIGELHRLAMREEGRQLRSQALCSFLEGCLSGHCPLAGGSLVALGDLFDEYIIPTPPSFCTGSFPEMLTRTTVQGEVLWGKWREHHS